ncbi:MAG: hypothetical protein UHD64_11255, partial [Bacteroidales bacterium]|nr:hypothetical protein [Bacteroidales bacterium]
STPVVEEDKSNKEAGDNNKPTTTSEQEGKTQTTSETTNQTKDVASETTQKKEAIPVGSSIEEKAKLVIRGDFGNGEERKMKLGSEYSAIQNKVNEMYAKGLVY